MIFLISYIQNSFSQGDRYSLKWPSSYIFLKSRFLRVLQLQTLINSHTGLIDQLLVFYIFFYFMTSKWLHLFSFKSERVKFFKIIIFIKMSRLILLFDHNFFMIYLTNCLICIVMRVHTQGIKIKKIIYWETITFIVWPRLDVKILLNWKMVVPVLKISSLLFRM